MSSAHHATATLFGALQAAVGEMEDEVRRFIFHAITILEIVHVAVAGTAVTTSAHIGVGNTLVPAGAQH